MVNHKIVHDGNSFIQLEKQLTCFYNQANVDHECAEDASFVSWARLQEIDEPASVRYWQQYLIGYRLKSLDLPMLMPAKNTCGVITKHLACDIIAALSRIASSCSATLSTVLLAGFYVVAERYYQQDDLCIGVVMNERPRTKTEMVGFFERIIPIRVQMGREFLITDFIRDQVMPNLVKATIHSAVRSRMMTSSNAGHDLFRLIFSYREHLERKHAGHRVHNDVALDVHANGTTLELNFDFSTKFYSDDLKHDFANNYLMLLKQISCHDAPAIGQFQISSSQASSNISPWFEQQRDSPQTIVDLYKKLHDTTSSGVILVCDDQSLSAQDFWRIVRAKTEHLSELIKEYHHDRSEVCIGISSVRSIDTISDLVAILLANCAFVPYDPRDPHERKSLILNDANVNLCLEGGNIYVRHTTETIPLKTTASCSSRYYTVAPERLAYIMYTSGSTGQPKGVRISHAALWHYALWWAGLRVNEQSKIVDFSGSLTFDASITTTLIALAFEKLIVVCPESTKQSAHAFLNYLAANKIDLCKTTPSYFKLLCNAMNDSAFSIPQALSWLLIGEDMNVDDCSQWIRRYPHHVFYNAYGPTEATVYCSTVKIDSENIMSFERKFPIENNSRYAQFHVVDTHLRQVPYGTKGELCIEGPILADGYHNKPEQSAAAFVHGANHGRWYRTGDYVVELCDHSIFFCGRKDQQLKIRGVRVELEEIRRAISLHPDVADVAITTKMMHQLPELVAVVVPRSKNHDKQKFVDLIRQYLLSKVSASMTPHQFIVLEKLPRNKAEKIDMQSLHDIVEQQDFTSGKMIATSPLEWTLLHLWRTVLKEHKIGTDSNFFGVGGNSLLAIEVIDKINRHFKVTLPLDMLFQKPTIRELGQVINKRCQRIHVSHFNQVPNAQALFMIHPATGMAQLYQLLQGRLTAWDFYGISSEAFGENVHSSVERMAAAYIKLLKEIRPQGPYFLGGYCTGGTIAFEMSRQLAEEHKTTSRLILIDSYNATTFGTDYDRAEYTRSQLEMMGLHEHSDIGRKMVRELTHNQQIVMAYRPRFYDGKCLFFRCDKYDQNERNHQHFVELVAQQNGWADVLSEKNTKYITLNSSHRGVFNNHDVLECIADEINSFIN